MAPLIDFTDQILYDIEDLCRARIASNQVPYHELMMHPQTAEEFDALWQQPRHEEVAPMRTDKVRFRFGTLSIIRNENFPVGMAELL